MNGIVLYIRWLRIAIKQECYYIGSRERLKVRFGGRMAEQRHISIPKPFASGDAAEWFKRFEICCKANTWDDEIKALKLPTLLEGEALATWMELSTEEQGDYNAAKKKMTERMVPASFVSMDGFLKRSLRSGEALSLYLYELKRLLDQAMPGLDATARSPLLLHQFMEGIPTVVSRQLRAAGDVKELDTALERARTLMTLEDQGNARPVAAMEEKQGEKTQVQKLAHQIEVLTDQVAALSVRNERTVRCFCCGQPGHVERQCWKREGNAKCFSCGRLGHIARNCRQQGNDNGTPVEGNRRPQ